MIAYGILYSRNKNFQRPVGEAWVAGVGARQLADNGPSEPLDVNGLIGALPKNLTLIRRCVETGRTYVQMDKPYFRQHTRECVRLSVNRFQPYEFLTRAKMPDDRLERLGVKIIPRDSYGPCVLLAGSSQKFCNYLELGDATDLATRLCAEIRKHTDAPIIYRPKPSWRAAQPIPGAEFSFDPNVSFADELKRSFVVVSYGSNAAIEALMWSTPVVSVGPSVVHPLVERDLANILAPRRPSEAAIRQYFSNIAYCMMSKREIIDGQLQQMIDLQLAYALKPERIVSC